MNGRPIRSRTSPESVVQIRPPASLRKVRTDSGFTNSLAIVRSVSSSRPSPSYTRMNSPRRKAASARSSATNSEELGGVYQDCCRNQFIGPHWEGRRPYFGRSHGAHDVVAATAQGIKLGCRVIAITSGGTLAELARKNDFSMFQVPAGLPPRGAFGHLFGILAAISGDWTVAEGGDELAGAVTHLKELRMKLRPERGMRSNPAKALPGPHKPIVPH